MGIPHFLSRPLSVALLAGLCLAAAAQEGTLRIGAMRLENNQYSVPIVLSGASGQVAALDFRLQYDPAVFRPVSAQSGPAAAQANKVVTANSPEPGSYVVVMMGLNQSTVDSGEVARVIMERVGQPESGQSELMIQEPTLATAQGAELPSRGMSRTVDFDEAAAPEEPDPPIEGEPEPTPEDEEEVAPEAPSEERTPPAGTPEGVSPGQGLLGGPPQVARRESPSSAAQSAPAAPGSAPGSAQTPEEPAGTAGDLSARVGELQQLRAGLEPPKVPTDKLGGGAIAGDPETYAASQTQSAGAEKSLKMAALAGQPSSSPQDLLQSSIQGNNGQVQTSRSLIRILGIPILVIIGLACGILVVVKFKRSG